MVKGWQRVLLIIIPYFIIVGIFQLIGIAVSGLNPVQLGHIKTTNQHFIISIFTLLGTFLVIWIFMKFVDEEPFKNLGFQFKNRLKDIVIGTVLGLLIMSMGYLILLWLHEIHFTLFHFKAGELIMSILLFIAISFIEEALFRGYVLRNLISRNCTSN